MVRNQAGIIFAFLLFLNPCHLVYARVVMGAAPGSFQYYKGVRSYNDHDYVQAMAWLKISARYKYYSEADLYVGLMYQQGLGVQRSYGRAYHWYLRAAKKGNVDAMVCIGLLYENGLGHHRDFQKAMSYYQEGAKRGSASACNALGEMYAKGEGVSPDYNQAFDWFKKSAEKGDPIGENLLGSFL
jgi:hypothetical protein